VADLIDPDTNCWNLPLIEEVFTMDEAKIISSIPLSPLKPNDLLIWRCMSNGQFTVRSAYHMEKELQTSTREKVQVQLTIKNCGGLVGNSGCPT